MASENETRTVEDIPGLPIPRLEFGWTPTGPRGGWATFEVEYRLIRRHLLGHVEAIRLGHTRVSGGGGSPFVGPGVDLPFRDRAHAFHDAAHFGLPVYALTPKGPHLLTADMEGCEHQAALGLGHRRPLAAAKGGA